LRCKVTCASVILLYFLFLGNYQLPSIKMKELNQIFRLLDRWNEKMEKWRRLEKCAINMRVALRERIWKIREL